jgi:hypothetical protein
MPVHVVSAGSPICAVLQLIERDPSSTCSLSAGRGSHSTEVPHMHDWYRRRHAELFTVFATQLCGVDGLLQAVASRLSTLET